jgi:hypothetical protein
MRILKIAENLLSRLDSARYMLSVILKEKALQQQL